mgnify:FL=1|jgi:hypothetical protein
MNDPMPLSDLEIYVKTPQATTITNWLSVQFPDLRLDDKQRQSTRNQHFLSGTFDQILRINVMEQPVRGFCILTLVATELPWLSDLALAEAFFAKTGATVRCSDGQWSEGADPDAWLEISADGTTEINWK